MLLRSAQPEQTPDCRASIMKNNMRQAENSYDYRHNRTTNGNHDERESTGLVTCVSKTLVIQNLVDVNHRPEIASAKPGNNKSESLHCGPLVEVEHHPSRSLGWCQERSLSNSSAAARLSTCTTVLRAGVPP